MSDTSDDMARDEAVRYARRLQAEIAADAALRRRRDPELQRLERDIERAWAHLAPAGASGPEEELLLDRVERLSMVDVDAPLGDRAGVRQIKGAVRKGTYWYLRYVSDQLNALHNVQGRLLRRVDARLTRLEQEAGLHDELDALLDGVPPPSAGVAAGVAARFERGPVLACDDHGARLLRALEDRGVPCYGIATDADAVVAAVDRGLDLRLEDPFAHLQGLPPASLAGVVLSGFVERRRPAELLRAARSALGAIAQGGAVVVAAEDPARRRGAEAELLRGRGLGPETWVHVLRRLGADPVEIVSVQDQRVDRLVVAHSS